MSYAAKGFQPPSTQVALGPFAHGFAVSASDTVPLPFTTRAIWVGTTGNLAVQLAGDAAPVILLNVPVGKLDLCATFIMATDTTAGDLVALA